jgi:hypothetical protein
MRISGWHRGEEVIVPSHIVHSHHLTHHLSTWPPNISTSPCIVPSAARMIQPINEDTALIVLQSVQTRQRWPVKAWQLGAQAMVERLGDRWGLNTASLSRRGSEVSERLCDVLVLRERFSWRAEEICREIIRPQNPQSYLSKKKQRKEI